jgi:AcrR family transcriptional regulator
MVVREGYHGLNMDRIAETLEYSKGTIYNHFPCKEEIIIALAIRTMEKRTDMFQRASAFRGKSRERMVAIGAAAELFVRLYPDHFMIEHIVRTASIWEKTSAYRQNLMRSCEGRCMSIVGGVIRDAIAHGDLELPEGTTPEHVVFGLWSFSYGAFSTIATSDNLVQLGIADPYTAHWLNITKMIDGFGWRPLSTEYDYEQTRERIADEVFSDEFRSIAT